MKRLLILSLLLTTLATVSKMKKEETIELPQMTPITSIGTNIELPTKEVLEIPIVAEPQKESLGEFKLTAYCSCKKCCGKWAQYGRTSTGTIPEEGRTIAVYTKVIPYGTVVEINGQEYIAEDTGVKGKHIDIYMNDHNAARKFGVQYTEIFIKGE